MKGYSINKSYGPQTYSLDEFDPWIHGSRSRQVNPAYAPTVDHITDEDLEIHVPWTSEKIDREALLTGTSLLNMVVPEPVKNVDLKAISILVAATAIIDNTMHVKDWENWWERKICGVSMAEWIERIYKGNETVNAEYVAYARATIKENTMAQLEIIQSRRRNGEDAAGKLYQAATASVDDYIDWRNKEGQFFGVLHLFSLAAGVDLRRVDGTLMYWTIKASIGNYDIHGRCRHKCEDELGSMLNFLQGSFGERATQIFRGVRNTSDLIYSRLDLSQGTITLLTRHIMSAALCNYGCERWMCWSSLHKDNMDAISDKGKWAHTGLADGTQAQTFTELIRPDSEF